MPTAWGHRFITVRWSLGELLLAADLRFTDPLPHPWFLKGISHDGLPLRLPRSTSPQSTLAPLSPFTTCFGFTITCTNRRMVAKSQNPESNNATRKLVVREILQEATLSLAQNLRSFWAVGHDDGAQQVWAFNHGSRLSGPASPAWVFL